MQFFHRLTTMLAARPQTVGASLDAARRDAPANSTSTSTSRAPARRSGRKPVVRALLPGRADQREATDQMRGATEEILSLVRKVDQHIEKQSARSLKLSILGERAPRAVETLPEIRVQQERMLESLEEIAACTRDHADQSRFVLAQLAAIADRVERNTPAQERLTGTIQSMHTGMERLNHTLEMRGAKQDRRDERADLRRTRSMRWLTLAVGSCAAGLFATAGAVVAMLFLA